MNVAQSPDFAGAEPAGLALTAREVPERGALDAYVEMLMLVERLHRELADLIKAALEAAGRGDPTPVQALMLYHLGSREMTAGELGSRGLYQGSNVSYNLKKLVEGGFVEHRRCPIDGRAVRLSLSQRGSEVHNIVEDLFVSHATRLAELAEERGIKTSALPAGLRLLRQTRSESGPSLLR